MRHFARVHNMGKFIISVFIIYYVADKKWQMWYGNLVQTMMLTLIIVRFQFHFLIDHPWIIISQWL